MRSLHYLDGGTLSPFPAEPEQGAPVSSIVVFVFVLFDQHCEQLREFPLLRWRFPRLFQFIQAQPFFRHEFEFLVVADRAWPGSAEQLAIRRSSSGVLSAVVFIGLYSPIVFGMSRDALANLVPPGSSRFVPPLPVFNVFNRQEELSTLPH